MEKKVKIKKNKWQLHGQLTWQQWKPKDTTGELARENCQTRNGHVINSLKGQSLKKKEKNRNFSQINNN